MKHTIPGLLTLLSISLLLPSCGLFGVSPNTTLKFHADPNLVEFPLMADYAGTKDVRIYSQTSWSIAPMPDDVALNPSYGTGNTKAKISCRYGEADTMLLILEENRIDAGSAPRDTIIIVRRHMGNPRTFEIDEDHHTVVFAPGLLRYQASTGTYTFADRQFDVLPASEHGNYQPGDDRWIDRFGWGLGEEGDPLQIVQIPTTLDFSDWGLSGEIIYNGTTYAKGTWRTLTQLEWRWLLQERLGGHFHDHIGLDVNRRGYACIYDTDDTIPGVLLFPDGCNPNRIAVSGTRLFDFKGFSENKADFTRNALTIEEWERLEAEGAVFLPVADRLDGTKGEYECYWTSSPHTEKGAYVFDPEILLYDDNLYHENLLPTRSSTNLVRLVMQVDE